MKESEVAQSHPTLCDPKDCSPQGSSIHGIFQAKVLELVAISFSRGSSWPRNQTQVSHIAGRFFTIWATGEAPWRLKRYVNQVQDVILNKYSFFYIFIFIYLFLYIYLTVLGLSRSFWTLSCGVWDLVPWSGIELGPPALGIQSVSHWTTS